MRIAVLGSNGQLGRELLQELSGDELFPLTRAEFDVTDRDRTRSVLSELRPEMIVNTTAFHRVDDCETKAELAYDVNVLSVLNLIRIANDIDATLVQFSSDYVFDGAGRTPYNEDSVALPLSIYGNSRLAGELLVRTLARRFFLIRTCGLYGHAGSRGKTGGNFVEIMLAKARNGDPIRVVNDQTLTPTATLDLARQLSVLLKTTEYGLYHATSAGECTWFEFAAAIFEIAGVNANLSPTTSELYKTPAKRPQYSVLENARLQQLGLNQMRHWRDALTEYLDARTSS